MADDATPFERDAAFDRLWLYINGYLRVWDADVPRLAEHDGAGLG
jgi:hypothetical protein